MISTVFCSPWLDLHFFLFWSMGDSVIEKLTVTTLHKDRTWLKPDFISSLVRSRQAGEVSGKLVRIPALITWPNQAYSPREVCAVKRTTYRLGRCPLNLLRSTWHFARSTGPVALQVSGQWVTREAAQLCLVPWVPAAAFSNLVMKHAGQSTGQWTLSSSTQMNIGNTISQQFALLHIGREK